MSKEDISMGADPEFFILNARKRQFVPAHTIFGDKYNSTDCGRGTAFRDGYAVEINMSPEVCRQSLTYGGRHVLKCVARRLPAGHVLMSMPAIPVNPASLRMAPPDVRVFGCDPSMNAYTGVPGTVPINAATHRYRYAGGHQHFSGGAASRPQNHITMAKIFDRFLGMPLSYIFASPQQYLRRRFYGRAGEFRTQNYPSGAIGFEYRTPGPELWRASHLVSFAFGVGRELVQKFEFYKRFIANLDPEPVIAAINTGVGLERLLRDQSVRFFYNFEVLQLMRARRERTIQLHHETNSAVMGGHGGWMYRYAPGLLNELR